MIPYGCQCIESEDIEAVRSVLKSDWLTQGPCVNAFEAELCAQTHAPYATAVSSATAGLHLACLALGVKAGDRVWTSPNSFVASSNAALYCGATVDFVDIDPQTYNMSPDALKVKLKCAAQQGQLPKVIVPVHFAGHACDMQRIRILADQYGCAVIEDAAHAIGGTYEGRPIGCCQYSDIAVFSFHPVKLMTTGEGGAVMTKSQQIHEKLQALRSHGIVRDAEHLEEADQGGWHYEQQMLGLNYRITDFQCALGLSQLKRLSNGVQQRRQMAQQYDLSLKALPVVRPQLSMESAWHLYVILLEDAACRRRVYDTLRQKNIGVQVHYIPIHTQPFYRQLGFQWGDFPEAEAYYQRTLTLPLHLRLTQDQQQYIVDMLSDVLTQ